MSEERKNSPRVRFNLLDVALIALALLCVVSVWQRGNLKKIFEESGVYQSYTVTFAAENISQATADALKAGTVLYAEDNGTRFVLGTLNDNVSVVSKGNWSLSVSGSLNCMLLPKDGLYFLKDGPQLALNMRFVAESETATLELVVLGIEKSD
ncbi:MAG: hypothetical protein E7644_03225 [Ruminococcaceae bacterium]|nr:hypothetical protein [Oscillospiraceae bacterium]